jgi:hypothetical protein
MSQAGAKDQAWSCRILYVDWEPKAPPQSIPSADIIHGSEPWTVALVLQHSALADIMGCTKFVYLGELKKSVLIPARVKRIAVSRP